MNFLKSKKKVILILLILVVIAGVFGIYQYVADFMSCHQTALMSCL